MFCPFTGGDMNKHISMPDKSQMPDQLIFILPVAGRMDQ